MREKKNSVIKNTSMLYLMNIAKLVLPLLTLPYLTRILSKDVYGMVSYVKSTMSYIQIIVDFGFILSATKDVVNTRDNPDEMNKVIGDTMLAKIMLLLVSLFIMIFMIFYIPILKNNVVYTILSFVVVILTCFLMDFVFRGLEEMQIITLRYIIMRGIATILTFFVIKSDADIVWIPILDIIASFIAIALIYHEMKKRNLKVEPTGIKGAFNKLKDSFIYFLSSTATTTFTALNTILIGIFLNQVQVAEWSLCFQMVGAVQSMYTPIMDGIYPHMVRTKDMQIVKKILKIFTPIIIIGCIFTYFSAHWILLLIGGKKYITATPLLRAFIPLLFISFPAMLFGWPMLGAINKTKETTTSTIIAAIFQVMGMGILYISNCFTAINLALLRGFTEFIMFCVRFSVYIHFKTEFKTKNEEYVKIRERNNE